MLSIQKNHRAIAIFGVLLLALIVFAGLLTLLFPIVLWSSIIFEDFEKSPLIFALLAPGLVVYGLFFPFDQILVMGGKPLQQTVFNLFVLCSNLLLNVLFVSHLGMVGAAVATTMTSVFMAPLALDFLVRKHLGLKLLSWKAAIT